MRFVLALVCIAVITAVNGGGLALAKSLESRAAAPALEQLTPDGIAVFADVGAADFTVDATPARVVSATQSVPTAPCSASDCSWLMPTVAAALGALRDHPITDSASMLLAMADALQVPPPRA